MMVLIGAMLVGTGVDSTGIDEANVVVPITDGEADGTVLAMMAEVEIGIKDVGDDSRIVLVKTPEESIVPDGSELTADGEV